MGITRGYGTPGGYITREKVRMYKLGIVVCVGYPVLAGTVVWMLMPSGRGGSLVWFLAVSAPLAFWYARRNLRTLFLPWLDGRAGEREVARLLGPLTHAGYEVLHDLDLGHGNVDHVVVGPSGVYAIETKALRGRFHLDKGGRLMCRGLPADKVRAQAVASAMRVRRQLTMFGDDVFVCAVVALTRSELPLGPIALKNATVVEAASLASWIHRRPVRLERDQIERATKVLAVHTS